MHKSFYIFFIFLFFGFTVQSEESNFINTDTELQIDPVINQFLSLISTTDNRVQKAIIKDIDSNWRDEYQIMLLEIAYFADGNSIRKDLIKLLEKKTGKSHGYDHNKWYEYIWNQPQKILPDYHIFKAKLHSYLDRKFRVYFTGRQKNALIRFDEIRWGGVKQDGIPPLRNPEMINANEADYLNDDHVVFGISVNGDTRAYPKRILAWHEMFTDVVGDVPVAGVYCTLCGTVILYETKHKGKQHRMGTSGFLYRSNKLMYDLETQSLWSTLEGKPVVGPLVGKGIELNYRSVVTTTWGEWKRLHPETKVLSLKTGYKRDYGEGVAYHNYFATDNLMFNVPAVDKQLKNKESILAIRLEEHPNAPLAIAVKFLKNNKIYQDEIKGKRFVVVTSKSLANRVYERKNISFKGYYKSGDLVDTNGNTWKINEDHLKSNNGDILKRIPAFNAFWFGWQAAYPDTRLIK